MKAPPIKIDPRLENQVEVGWFPLWFCIVFSVGLLSLGILFIVRI